MNCNSVDRVAVVIGAGPAGMGTAIGLIRKGVRVFLIEQQEGLGPERRGETIRHDEEMDRILGGGFLDKIALRRISRRRYYSHSGRCHVDRTIKNPNIIFSWPVLIQAMGDVACREGVVIRTGTRAYALVVQDGTVAGIRAVAGKSEQIIRADTVFICCGCDGPASLGIHQDRSGTDMAVSKRLVTGYSGPDDRLEYHFHLDPAGLVVGTMFPRGHGEAELILLDTSGSDRGLLSFDAFRQEHPLFSELMEGTHTTYHLETRIPMGGMIFPFSPMPGLVMAGDALGHVQARGGSGIKTSFLIGHTAGSLAADIVQKGGWTLENWDAFERVMRGHRHVRSLRLHNLVYAGLRSRLFKHVRSPEHMDRVWSLLSIALR